MRTLITQDPFEDLSRKNGVFDRGVWPCKWIQCAEAGEPPYVTAYLRRFSLGEAATIRVHVSADERYELFVDGRRIGRGPERGDANNWFYETYDLAFEKGGHVIVAKVMTLGFAGLRSQISVHSGFILAPQETEHIDLLGTGVAEWKAKKIPGYNFERPFEHDFFSIGYNALIDGALYPWGVETGEGDGWQPVMNLHAGADAALRNRYPAIHLMKPALLPAMVEKSSKPGVVRFVCEAGECDSRSVALDPQKNLSGEVQGWNSFVRGDAPVTIPAKTSRRIVVDLENYFCAYPEICVSGGGGASVRLHWAESLFCEQEVRSKGNRDEITGKYFSGIGDTFFSDGSESRIFEPLLWRAGRYVEIVVRTAETPLIFESLELRETHYPLEIEMAFESADPRLESMIPRCVRTLEMSAHDSYVDGPYYEQMMWAGDGVQTTLATYVLTRDDRLQRKSLYMFNESRLLSGLTRARWPARDTMIIAPYSLYWVNMVRDFAFWRGDMDFVRSLMPGVRAVVDAFLGFLNRDGLVEIRHGWNFVDWVPGWTMGIPPGGDSGVNSTINWHFVRTLAMVAELEECVAEPELAARARRLTSEVAHRVTTAFWDERRRLFADDISHEHFSEHAQCFAILSGQLEPALLDRIALFEDTGMTRTTISFTHFLFESYCALGRMDAMHGRLDYWFQLDKLGFKTLPEGPEPSRSDCHAWGAHPLYHFFASILGIRPSGFGFGSVTIRPQLGPLATARGTLVHPCGRIEVDFTQQDGVLAGHVVLPPGISGTLINAGNARLLEPGYQKI